MPECIGGTEIIMIYIVEDDKSIRDLVVYAMESVGFDARGFERPSEFYEALENGIPDLILLDIMLPETDGLTILRRLHAVPVTSMIPVIMMTAKGTEYDKVIGLDSGADDYITKPFGMMELISRVKAILRRVDKGKKADEYVIGPLSVSEIGHSVKVNGENVVLTLKEFDLLCLLLKNQNIVLTRDTIHERIWGYSFDGESRTVDVHIRTLRQKLGEAGALIETIRGVGYKIGGGVEK